MVPIQNVKMTVGPIWNTGGTETEISLTVSVLGPQWAGTEMGSDQVYRHLLRANFLSRLLLCLWWD